MIVWIVGVTVLAGAVFGIAAPRVSRRLPPAAATWLMSAGGFLAAASSSTALALLAFRVVAQTRTLTSRGHWSNAVLDQQDPVSTPVAVAAVTVLAIALASGVVAMLAGARATLAAYHLAAEVGGGELHVLNSGQASALAVPGRHGRIVVTSGLLRRLDGPQRRALLAHERAHLRHRHHLHQTATTVAVALNPLLWPLRSAVRLSCERWADEEAASVSPRGTVAQALLQAAGAGASAPGALLAAAAHEVADRIAALDEPAPRMRLGRAAILVCVLVAAVATVGYGMHRTETVFEVAQAAWRAGQR